MENEQLTPVYLGNMEFMIGRAYTLRQNTELTLIPYGTVVHCLLEASRSLFKLGISAEIIDLTTLKPFDSQAVLASVHKRCQVMTLEDHGILGGPESADLELRACKEIMLTIRAV